MANPVEWYDGTLFRFVLTTFLYYCALAVCIQASSSLGTAEVHGTGQFPQWMLLLGLSFVFAAFTTGITNALGMTLFSFSVIASGTCYMLVKS